MLPCSEAVATTCFFGGSARSNRGGKPWDEGGATWESVGVDPHETVACGLTPTNQSATRRWTLSIKHRHVSRHNVARVQRLCCADSQAPRGPPVCVACGAAPAAASAHVKKNHPLAYGILLWSKELSQNRRSRRWSRVAVPEVANSAKAISFTYRTTTHSDPSVSEHAQLNPPLLPFGLGCDWQRPCCI